MTSELEGGTDGRETRHGPLIMTLFALYARGERNWLSVASVVKLMADLGVESGAVRSSVFRLKRRGILQSQRQGSAAGYALSEATLATLTEGDARIFARERASVQDGWVLVVFSVPESEREKRYELRASLTHLGFGTVAPGVWIAPGKLAAEARRVIERAGLGEYVDLFVGEHLAFGDLAHKVRAWWDLDGLAQGYADFVRRYTPALETAAADGGLPAFQLYIPMLTAWRRLPYRDPGLPLSLLPADWNGVSASALFEQLDTVLGPPAREHALSVIHGM